MGLVALVLGRRSVLAPAAVSRRRAGVWCHARLPPPCGGPGVRALAASESSIASRVAAIRESGLSFKAIARNSRVDDHMAAKFSVVVSAALTAGWRAAEAVGRKAFRSAHDPRCAGAAVGQGLGVAVVVSDDQDSPVLAVAHVENRSSATSVQPPSSWVRLSSRSGGSQMPPEDATSTAVDRAWILHSPYAEPLSHWALDEHGRATETTTPGRRPSSTQLPVPTPRGDDTDWARPDPDIEPHGTINRLRWSVAAWRAQAWPGVAPRVHHLLEYWSREGPVMRPFWCQRDAVETLIWLFDAGRTHDPAAHAAISEHLAEVNSRWNAGIPRVAVKMATGTGKTNLMAMLGLWWTAKHPGRPVDFLVLTPGLTIRDRLQVLANIDSEVWESVAPRGFDLDVKRIRWTILNFQAFQRQSTLEVGGKTASGKEKRLLYGPGRKPDLDSWRESEVEMLDRLLKNHRAGGSLVVINDEAHHCYTLQGVDLADGAVDLDEKDETKRAELWFGALRALRAADRLAQVFDLSATPMWLRRPAQLRAETFPWTVSDFSLIDAVESGLVKVPRVPVDDTALDDQGRPVHLQPRYRNVYLYNEKRAIGAPLAPHVAEPLHQLYDHYALETFPAYAESGRTPVLILVANTIENATALYRYIAGYKDGPIWKPGHLPLFSNVDPATGSPRVRRDFPTLLVHSRVDDPADGSGTAIAEAIAEQARLFAPDAKTADDKRQAVSPENSWRVPIPVQTQEPPCGTSAVLTTTCATTEALA